MKALAKLSKLAKSAAVRALVWTVCLSLASGPALAAVPANIIYQGSMRRSGAPYSGPATFVFRITDAAGGPTYWTSGNQVLTVTGSFFRYALGTPNQAAFNLIDWANITPYIEVTVDGTTLLPREQLNAVPYAIYAGSIPYVSPGAGGVMVSNNLLVTGGGLTVTGGNVGIGTAAPAAPLDVVGAARTGYLTIAPTQSVLLGRDPLIANEATTKAYVDAIAGVGGGGVLASTNTWSAWQTHLNQVTYSTDVYFSAGQINMLGNRVTTVAGKLDATQLANTVPAVNVVGAYPSVTGVGTLTAGTWNAAIVDPVYGGTGANLSAGAAGGVPYFIGGGVMGAVPAGTAGQVLESNGAGSPGWVSPNQSSLLSSTNTWSAWQTHLNQVTFSTDVYFSAGRINLQGNRVTTIAGKLNAAELANTVPLASLSGITNAQLASGTFPNITGIVNAQLASGSFSNITGVGTLTAGTWNGTTVGPTYGGTGANFSGAVLGGMPYFLNGGVMAAIGAGLPGQLLQSNGAASPTWVTGQTLANNLVGGAAGSIPYQAAADLTTMLPIGAAGQIMVSNGAAPTWSTGYAGSFTFSGGYGSVAGTANDLTIGAGGSSPNAVSMKFGDNTGWRYNIGTNVGGTFTTRLSVHDTGEVGIGTSNPSEMLEIRGTGSGIYLNGNTSNILRFNTDGVDGPTFTSRSVGTKLLLYPSLSGTDADYAIGVESGALWYSMRDTSSSRSHRFYGGTTELMRIRGDGRVGIGVTSPAQALDVAGNVQASGGAIIGDMGATWSSWREALRLNTGSHAAITNPTGNLLFGLHSNSNFYWADTTVGYSMVLTPTGNLSLGSNAFIAGTTGDTYFNGGNVGIGNTSPGSKLDVAGDIRSTGQHIINNTFPTIYLQDSTDRSGMIHMNSGLLYFLSGSGTNSLTWAINGSNWPLTINMTTDVATFGGEAHFMEGNVGIGTSSPNAKLHIGGIPGTDGIRFPDGSLMVTASLGSAGVITNFGDAQIQADSDNSGGGQIHFDTGPNRRMTIENNGEVGIGDSTPSYLLDVAGQINSQDKITANQAAGTGGGFSFTQDGSQDTGMFSAADGVLDFYNNGNRRMRIEADGDILFDNNPTLTTSSSYITIPNGVYVSGGTGYFTNEIQARDGIADDNSDPLMVRGGTSGRTQITGDLGVGKAPGGYRLEVDGNIFSDGGWLRTNGDRGWYNDTYNGGWHMSDSTWIRSYGSKDVYINSFLRADGGIASGSIVSDGNGTIRSTGQIRAGGNLRIDGLINCIANDCPSNGMIRSTPNLHLNSLTGSAVIVNWDNGAGANQQVFRVGNGSSTDILEVVSNGRVSIGNYTPSVSDPLFTVNGDAQKSGGGSWIAFSDERLKDIGANYNVGLAEVLKLQPLRYRYKVDNAMGIKDTAEHIGFSAQEVEKVLPDAVTLNGKGYRGVNNDPIIWAMLNAIKEQQKQIEALQAEIKQLKTP